jgi:signal transduction histidine kinase
MKAGMDSKMDDIIQNNNALDALPFLVWLSGETKAFDFVNAQWLNYTGRGLNAEAVGAWLPGLHPGDSAASFESYSNAFDRREAVLLKCRIRNKEGKYNWFTGEAAPRYDEHGHFLGYAGAFVQLLPGSSAAELEATVASQALALKELHEKLADKKVAQERNNAELESFTYIASHDLQEPLRKIQSFSKMIMAKDSANFSDAGKDYFSRIMMAAERMQRLIDDLLSYSGTRVSDISFEEADLGKVLNEVITNFQEVIEEKKALVECGTLPTLPVIRFQVHQLFTNVLANALKFSRTDVPVIIRISATQVNSDQIHSIEDVRPGTYWQISFSDNGIGFEQQYENRIFELFQRLHGKNEYVGTGIGLAICKKIVHNHHGHITATGRPGEGSVFNIYLPVTGTTSQV